MPGSRWDGDLRLARLDRWLHTSDAEALARVLGEGEPRNRYETDGAMVYGSEEHRLAREIAARFARRLRSMAEEEPTARALVFLEIADLLEADAIREKLLGQGHALELA